MNDPGIKKQVKAHWRRLQEEIEKPSPECDIVCIRQL